MTTFDGDDDKALWRRLTPSEPAATPCPEAAEVAAFLDGAGRAEEHEGIERHLRVCTECRSAVTDLRAALADVGDVGVPAGVVERARRLAGRSAAIEGARSPAGPAWHRWPAWGAVAAGVAVVGVIGFAAGHATALGRARAEQALRAELSFGLAAPGDGGRR